MKQLIKSATRIFIILLMSLGLTAQNLPATGKIKGKPPTKLQQNAKENGFLGPDRTICLNSSTTIVAPIAFSYRWNTGAITRSIQVSPLVHTEYWVTIFNLQQQSQTDTIRVFVNPLPNVVVSPLTTNLLPGEAVLLTASGATDYLWSNGNRTNKIFVKPTNPENTYWVDGTDQNGCTRRATASVSVTYTTIPSITAAPTCIGDTTYLEAKITTNDTIISINWALDGDMIFDDGTGMTQKKRYDTAGERLVGIKVTTKYSLSAITHYKAVLVGDKPVANFVASSNCATSPIQFSDRSTVAVGNIQSWNWQFGNGQSSTLKNPLNTYQQAGSYTIQLAVSTTAGCSASVTQAFNTTSPPVALITYFDGSPIASFPLKLYKDQTIRLRASGVYDSVIWNNLVKSNSFLISRGGTNHVNVFKSGCIGSKQFTVLALNEYFDPNLKIQNILTPNGDGFNDAWEISILSGIRPAKVTVFSRAGLVVFESPNYNNDWKGTYNNNPLPEGSYFYIIEGKNGEVFKGTITLLR